MKRELLQLAHTFNPDKHCVGGYFASEKLDGMRCFWDGGTSRGRPSAQIPWANTAKDFRLKEEVIATGLWSRYGKVIRAPDWFLDKLPPHIPLDGELYLGPGQFQELVSIVKRHDADNRWEFVKYCIFEIVPTDQFYLAGRINNPNYKTDAFDGGAHEAAMLLIPNRSFERQLGVLDTLSGDFDPEHLSVVWQEKLPIQTQKAEDRVEEMMYEVQEKGGEGIILRKPESIWLPRRTQNLLKVKPVFDSEAVVTGYVWGKGKLENLMGTLVVQWQGKTFELSGFTNAERELVSTYGGGSIVGGEPGTPVAAEVCSNKHFPIGSKVTFKFRELSNDGIPKEARYMRPAAE